MPILDYAVPCQLTSLDQRTNAVSLFSVIESLDIGAHPGESEEAVRARSVIAMEVVTLWRRLPEDSPDKAYTQVVTIEPPGSPEQDLSAIDFTLSRVRHRVHTQLPPLTLPQSGVYCLRVYLQPAEPGSQRNLVQEYPISVRISTLPLRVRLQDDEITYLQRPVTGQGGFQSLLKRIQAQIVGDELVLNASDAERLVRYGQSYGSGGFQGRLSRVVGQIQKQLRPS